MSDDVEAGRSGSARSTEVAPAAEVTSAAGERDRRAEERDAAADRRDLAGDVREHDEDEEDDARDRGSTRLDYRAGARGDRVAAAEDRRAAAEDRRAAAEDRRDAADQIRSLMRDELTGFYQRGAGLAELEREVAKCRRTGEAFTVVFLDVDGLKSVNDAEGHGAGDRLIARVAEAIRAGVRDYDVVVRYGGDEFVCGLQGLDGKRARDRFAQVCDTLTASGGGSASFGVAERLPDESLAEVISRADTAMYAAKGHRRRDG
jgi:diguanylate cyclase (GGDEF)-like protein